MLRQVYSEYRKALKATGDVNADCNDILKKWYKGVAVLVTHDMVARVK